ncbi:MAG: hypothetical protein IJI38_02840 [Clostridia bacterium]|nr:hypothetical protein [Clostridia bacterium]
MAYFRNHSEPEKEHEQQFVFPVDEDETEDIEDWENEEEIREARKDRYRLVFAIRDLFGMILGALCILALLALLISLVSWVISDLSQSFSLLGGL